MKKRYWLIGALLIYALFKQTDDGSTVPTSQDAVSSRVERAADIEPEEVSAEPTRELSSAKVEMPSGDVLELRPADAPIRYVSGKRVGFRSGPSTTDPIIDRFDAGRKVLLMERAGDWSRIRDDLTQHEGWIATRFLSEIETRTKAAPAKKEKKPEEIEVAVPVIPDSVLIQRIIAESLDAYPSSCACPYSRDRAGRRCGKRSAYSKPGGYAPVCFPGDVTKAMIDAFKSR
ncbi:SH3 domain-containing protein [Sinorhizobium medicae]|uniref:SH3 domain-containing protein n=1 Tax=Sinorhizobium medicae TaxID=110321 RepID=UPI002AF6A2BB|nr:SH3 domain-containing protein [Sinorhizobium medicae]WQO48648.1 SH3 domain-containing protein [Sinorhizobium medicae]WQO68896.1 SH3 domain-containing protein [Sinorhizobium medicae]WQO77578.1 SH3 domain-containing protein [Sinorhizobium medicae]